MVVIAFIGIALAIVVAAFSGGIMTVLKVLGVIVLILVIRKLL